MVHRGEFVFTQEATNRIGVGNLYRMMRGYATGGLVGGEAMKWNDSLEKSSVTVNMGGILIGQANQQPSGSAAAVDHDAIMRQLKPAMISVVSEQASKPGTPLWSAIRGKR